MKNYLKSKRCGIFKYFVALDAILIHNRPIFFPVTYKTTTTTFQHFHIVIADIPSVPVDLYNSDFCQYLETCENLL
jgi:hypothetical protein